MPAVMFVEECLGVPRGVSRLDPGRGVRGAEPLELAAAAACPLVARAGLDDEASGLAASAEARRVDVGRDVMGAERLRKGRYMVCY